MKTNNKRAIKYHEDSIKCLQKQIDNNELVPYLNFCAKEDIRARKLRLKELEKDEEKTNSRKIYQRVKRSS